MTEPSVCCVMLTRDRPAMARRAVECFRAQTYARKTLLIVNSGCGPLLPEGYAPDIMEPCYVGADAQTIGELRNRGAKTAAGHNADILIHWDDDDYSHPNRIAEQVALLQASGADCVGYREMLFWNQKPGACDCVPGRLSGGRQHGNCATDNYGSGRGRAWLYSAQGPEPQLLGTSLCYWRKTWERRQFEATSLGEDAKFCAGIKCVGISSLKEPLNWCDPGGPESTGFESRVRFNLIDTKEPRMIARIHSGNASTGYTEQNFRAAEWRRVPEWDSCCRTTLALR